MTTAEECHQSSPAHIIYCHHIKRTNPTSPKITMVELINPSLPVPFPKDRKLSWRDRYQIRRALGKADRDKIMQAQQVCYDDMKQSEVELVLKGHEDEVSALFRLGARKLNASHLASTVDDIPVSPSIPYCRPSTSQRQPSVASLVTPITSQTGALGWFSRV